MAFAIPWGLAHAFQIALTKPYFDMGLKELARVAGYPVAAIQSCSQFKRTHSFLMEVWQALYQVIVQRFIEANTESSNIVPHLTDIIHNASLHVKSSETDFEARLAQLRDKIEKCYYHKTFPFTLCLMQTLTGNFGYSLYSRMH